jgi:hypothetical protein
VLVTWRQKNAADQRSEWWRRTARAFERSLLRTLFESRLATKNDSDVVQVIAEHMTLSGYNRHHGSSVDTAPGSTR